MASTVRHVIRTFGQGDAHDITAVVARAVGAVRSGLATVFVVGSTGAVTTIEFEPGAIEI